MWNRFAEHNRQFARQQVATLAKARAELTPAFAAFLSPIAVTAFALGVWALFSQMAVAANFPIKDGALADWRVWLVIAGLLEFVALRVRAQQSSDDTSR